MRYSIQNLSKEFRFITVQYFIKIIDRYKQKKMLTVPKQVKFFFQTCKKMRSLKAWATLEFPCFTAYVC